LFKTNDGRPDGLHSSLNKVTTGFFVYEESVSFLNDLCWCADPRKFSRGRVIVPSRHG